MIELEVLAVTMEPMTDEEKEQLRARTPQPPAGTVVVSMLPDMKHAVTLRARGGQRILKIYIGEAEAKAIALAQQNVARPRPLTHDFIGNLFAALEGVEPVRLLLTKLEEETFYAELEISQAGRLITVDCRPSDGIAVAVRLGLPVVARETLEPAFAAA